MRAFALHGGSNDGGKEFSFDPASVRERFSIPDKYTVLPGLCDVHVHFREPGFSYKETIRTGTLAAAVGGYTAVCTMPNLDPVPDSVEHVGGQLEIIERDAAVNVYPYGSVTVGEKGEALSDLEGMAKYVVAFSDDGRGIQDREIMRQAMIRAKKLGKVIAAHCEDNSLLNGGYIHAGRYAWAHGHRGICSESEWKPIERDIGLVRETGCAYHVCHVSCKESVELIRRAKAEGLNVTCETAPHYLILCEDDLREDGRFKMNPPLRSREDRDALIEGVRDGTVDMIATDHAPHSADEKSRGLENSLFGVSGIEIAFPVLYTGLVLGGHISLGRLTELTAYAPRERFGVPLSENDFSVWDLADGYTVDPGDFVSMGRSTPFAGSRVFGRCIATVCGGREAYRYKSYN